MSDATSHLVAFAQIHLMADDAAQTPVADIATSLDVFCRRRGVPPISRSDLVAQLVRFGGRIVPHRDLVSCLRLRGVASE